MGSRAITTPHHLTTVPLARLGTDEVGGGLFLAVCKQMRLAGRLVLWCVRWSVYMVEY